MGVDTAIVGETPPMESEELGEGKTGINEGSGWEERRGNVLEEVVLAKKSHFTLKELSKLFHIIESAKDKIPEADLN